MSWLSRLYQTYEAVSNNPDAQLNHALMPFYHVKQNVQIIVTISDKGDFISARLARDGNGKLKSQVTTIPATNDSATRTSSPVAHPLADKLQYVGKDFFAKSKNKKDLFALYEQTLTDWCNSPFSHPKAQAVLHYVQKGTLTQDLINEGIVIADDTDSLAYPSNASDYPESILSLLIKNGGEFDQGSAFIAWEVMDSDIAQADITTWGDESLFTAWQNYYASFDSKEGFCHITGETAPLASKHPNRVLKSASNAKLISANDMSGFTFLGRFTDDDKSIAKQGYQAVNISATVTEKAHSALAWLLTNQGHEESGQAVVAWAVDGSKLPQPFKPILSQETVETVIQETIEDELADDELDEFAEIGESEKVDEHDEQPTKREHHKDIGSRFAHGLKKAMQGYRQKLPNHEQISVISLDSATPGRMAVTYYYEAMPDDYIEAMEDWYENFAWYAFYFDKETNQRHMTIQAPTPYQIAVSAYGLRLPDAVKKQVVSQVLPVIVEGHHRQIPKSIIDLCVKRACNPLGIENWEWEQNLSVACGLYRGYFNRLKSDKKRSYTVALQEDYTSRDYLYGRLLATAENLEGYALYVAGETRTTTAQRYMQQFANRPFSTWRNIELALDPYIKRLNNNRPEFLRSREKLLNDIMSKFEIQDFNNDSALSGEFLLGYHSQKMAFELARQANQDKNTAEKSAEIN